MACVNLHANKVFRTNFQFAMNKPSIYLLLVFLFLVKNPHWLQFVTEAHR